MTNNDFKSKVAFIVEADGLLNHYIDSVIIKDIKSAMTDEAFQSVNTNHIHAAMILKNIAPCSLKRFAAALRMSKASASALADRMVRGGLVLREPDPQNRRQILLSVNPDFESHITDVRSKLAKWFEGLADEMGMDLFEKWYDVMMAVSHVLDKTLSK